MEGVVNEDLPNSWECPKCCKEGKNVEYRVSGLVFITYCLLYLMGDYKRLMLLSSAVINFFYCFCTFIVNNGIKMF